MRANTKFHVHGLTHAGTQILLLNINSALSKGAFDGTPRGEVIFAFEELNFIGRAQFRVVSLDLNCVLVFASLLTGIRDMNAWARNRNLGRIPNGARIRIRGLDDDRACPGDTYFRAVSLREGLRR